jgi:D-alanine--poly(phosphoribitol) ligase subunit 1
MNFKVQAPHHLTTIAKQCLLQQDKVAIHTPRERLTYSQLYQEIWWLAKKYELSAGNRIGIVIDDSPYMYAAMIACWFAGKAYVPLAPNYPAERLIKIIEIAGIRTIWQNQKALPESVSVEHVIQHTDTQNQVPDKSTWNCPTTLNHEAYVLFTSGTSGEPKGVPISHKNIQAFVNGFIHLNYVLSKEDRFLQMFDITFDLSVMSFTIPLYYGACFYTIDKSKIKPFALYEAMDSHQITFALLVPSVVNMLQPYLEDEELPALKITQFCGEALTISQVQTWQKCCPNSQIDNVYGPTEATIYCSRYTAVPSEYIEHKNGIVCIGKPLLETTFEIVDDELCIGGNQVTAGYLNANETHKQKFYDKLYTTYYKSGDIGEVKDENYYCLGRADFQVKIQGHRIELSEIEFTYEHTLKMGRCVAVHTKANEQDHIVLFLIAHQTTVSNELILQNLSKHLPAYMIPHSIKHIAEFPLNANGKIDRNKLASWG